MPDDPNYPEGWTDALEADHFQIFTVPVPKEVRRAIKKAERKLFWLRVVVAWEWRRPWNLRGNYRAITEAQRAIDERLERQALWGDRLAGESTRLDGS